MAQYTRKPKRFECLGICLSREIDDLPQYKFNILKNVRSYKQGVIQPRSGLLAYNSTPIADLSIHSMKRLNNDLATASLAFALIIGAGSSIYSDTNISHNSFTSRASGFSGNPLSIVPFRPNNSPEPFAYISDSLKQGKMKSDGTFRNMGIFPPISAPGGTGGTNVPSINPLQSVIIDSGIKTNASWSTDGVLFSAAVNSQPDAALIIATVLYDTGTTGWANIVFTPALAPSFYQVGTMIRMNLAGEEVVIDSIYKPIKTTTIAAITYDLGATGLCTIQPTAHKRKALIPNNVILLNSGGGSAEYVRILSVSFSNDDVPSLRCSTVNTHTAGESITGVISWRAIFQTNHVGGEFFQPNILAFSGLAQLPNTSKTGFGTRVIALDLSNISGRPLQDEDELNFIIRVRLDAGATFTEIQIMLDCGDGSFSQNYFFIPITLSAFSNITGASPLLTTATARQKTIQQDQISDTPVTSIESPSQIRERIQRRLAKALANGNTSRASKLQNQLDAILNNPQNPILTSPSDPSGGPNSNSIQIGSDQYVPVRVKIKDITRVGSDFTKGWADIVGLRVRATLSNPTTGNAGGDISFGGFWVGGSFGPDVGEVGTPYIYRYRYRSSESGAKSFPSPSTRSGVLARRQRIQLSALASSDLQVDKIDWFRFGGSLNLWTYIGTGPNSTSTFNDDLPDLSIIGNENLTFEDFQPFPITSLPITGLCNVSGTTVIMTSGSVSLQMAPGTNIIINGIRYTLYSSPMTTTKFEIVENGGNQSNVSIFIPSPTLMGQPLPSLWGPFQHEGEIGSVMFACGDTNNEGYLYWTNANDPDSASDTNFLEITSPSEPLLNGFVYDSRAWVFSSEDLFQIYPSQTITGRLTFKATRTGLGLGLAGRYAFCTFEGKIAFISKDGIYITEGHTPVSITDDDLYPLFPHDGQVGLQIGNNIPPDFTQPNKLRLSEGGGEIRFDYLGTDGNYYTLLYNIQTKSWWPDEYGRQIQMSYWEEKGKSSTTGRWLLGSIIGKVFINTGTSDDSLPISCQVRTICEDGGDFRTNKKFGDFVIDYDLMGLATISAQIGFDNYSILPAPTILSTPGRKQTPIDINNGQWTYAKNAALDISWSSAIDMPKLYAYELTAIQTEEDTFKRGTDADNLGIDGAKWVQGFRIRCNTYNQIKTFKVQSDTGVNGLWTDQLNDSLPFSINSNGESIQAFTFETPFICHLIRIIGTDNVLWSLLNYEFVFENEPELVEDWITQQTTHDIINYQHINYLQITLMSTNIVNLVIIADGIPQSPIQIPSTGGLRLKKYVRIPAIKAKTFQYSLTTNVDGVGFRVYQRDLELAVKGWGDSNPYRILQPFGDISRIRGASI